MKITILSIKFLILAFVSILVISCSVEDGQDGAIGTQGIAGIDGEDGNANVIASDWFPSEFSSTASLLEITSIENEIFNEETASNAIVLVYGRRIDGVFGLPVVFDEESYFFIISPDDKSLWIVGQNILNRPSIYSSFEQFRYIVIPGNTTEKNNKPDFNKMSYYEVMNYFALDY